ncbi:MAG: DUF2203 domain-containing protein [Phycisphaerae bacterium]
MTRATPHNDKQSLEPTPKRYFTLAEARRALVLVNRIAMDIQRIELQRRKLVHQTASSHEQPSAQQANAIEAQFDIMTEQLSGLLEELAAIGVELKDPTRGLLDFPSRFNGRDILLCWQIGEPTINFWHDISAGFAGRRSVGELELHPQTVG